MKKNLIFSIFLLIGLQIFAQSKTQFKKQLKNEIDNIRENKNSGNVYAFDKYFKIIPNVIFDEISVYEKDSVKKIRRFAFEIINLTGINNNNDSIRKTAVNKLITACGDNNFDNRNFAASCLKRYSKKNFDKKTKLEISNLLEKDYTYYQHIVQLAGYLDMKEEIPELQGLLSDTTHNNQQIKWKIHTTLARLGVEESIDYCVNYVKSKDMNDLLIRYLLVDLVYIKQPESIGFLVSELYNEEKNCRPANPNSTNKITCAYRIMEMLAPVIEDYPYKVKYGTQLETNSYEDALKKIRKWFKEHPDYKINKEIF